MRINFAHLRERATNGGYIDFAVFDARSNSGTDSANAELLYQLTNAAKVAGYKVDQSALAFSENGRNKFYGTKNLVDYLANNNVLRWTHYIDV